MAAVLGRTLGRGLMGDGGRSEVLYFDNRRRGLLDSKFAMYYIVTISLNSIGIAAAIVTQLNSRLDQVYFGFQSYKGWYFCNAIFGVLHILAALYVVHKIEAPAPFVDSAMAVPHGHATAAYTPQVYNHDPKATAAIATSEDYYYYSNTTEPETWARIKDVLCQSRIFAVYILVFCAYVIWLTFYEIRAFNYPALLFVSKAAHIFEVAGPASFALSAVLSVSTKRR